VTIEFSRESMQSVQDTLRRDPGVTPPPPYFDQSPRNFGTEPISIDRYISLDYLRREYERVWFKVWQWACNAEDIPNVGDHLVYDIGDKSVLIVRAGENEIKAYRNACLHRGRQLKTEPGNATKIACGFHGWTWNLDGTLARIPCRWDFPQVKEEEFALPKVRCETWSQFVFINLDDDCGPLADALDILPEHYRHYPMDDKFTAAHVQKVIPANWKVTMEAFIEAYHEIATHPQLLEWTGDANSQYDVWERSSRIITLTAVNSPHLGHLEDEHIYGAVADFYSAAAAGLPTELPPCSTARSATADLTRMMMQQGLGLDWSDKSDAEVIDTSQYWVFPNWCPWSGLAQALQYRYRPNGDDPHSCIFDVRMMYPVPPDQPRPPKAPLHVLEPGESWTNAPELAGFGQIMDQDESNLIALQRGLRATKKTGANFSEYQESRIRHFHQLLDQHMARMNRRAGHRPEGAAP
jgi:phenylpropionate dioxygenase-like ring-hydroxylating dioxygenase large terminal subunit